MRRCLRPLSLRAPRTAPTPSAPRSSIASPRSISHRDSRWFHATRSAPAASRKADDAPGPTSFSDLDVLGNTPAPSTSVDVCTHDGFALNSGATTSGGDGALLVNGLAFAWRPWELAGKGKGKGGEMTVRNAKGQVELPREAFGLFDVLWPRPDLLVIGVGKHNMPLSAATRRLVADLGMRVEVLDTRNAAAQFNLLATERGVAEVAAAMIPVGWVDGTFAP